jgi:hypothetical protein
MRRWGTWLRESLFERSRFEVWAAPAPGQNLFLEACGLRRRAVLAVAREYLRRRPMAAAVVIDDAGSRVYWLERERADRR